MLTNIKNSICSITFYYQLLRKIKNVFKFLFRPIHFNILMAIGLFCLATIAWIKIDVKKGETRKLEIPISINTENNCFDESIQTSPPHKIIAKELRYLETKPLYSLNTAIVNNTVTLVAYNKNDNTLIFHELNVSIQKDCEKFVSSYLYDNKIVLEVEGFINPHSLFYCIWLFWGFLIWIWLIANYYVIYYRVFGNQN